MNRVHIAPARASLAGALSSGGAVDASADEALSAAARNLTNAETVTDLALMERLVDLGRAWTDLAAMLNERETA